MITLLRKLFIKNYKDVTNKEVRKKHGILAAVGGIFINLLLFGIKLLIGILTFSMSIISDAINNLSDMFSCFVTLIGFIFASKKADSKHPYGHERIEYIVVDGKSKDHTMDIVDKYSKQRNLKNLGDFFK